MHVESEMHCLMAMEKRKLSLFSLPSNNGLKKIYNNYTTSNQYQGLSTCLYVDVFLLVSHILRPGRGSA